MNELPLPNSCSQGYVSIGLNSLHATHRQDLILLHLTSAMIINFECITRRYNTKKLSVYYYCSHKFSFSVCF